jgi:hypothetical protein
MNGRAQRFSLTLLFLLLPCLSEANQPNPEQHIQRGTLCLEMMDYDCVDRELKALRDQITDGGLRLTPQQKRSIHLLSTESLLSQKNWEPARAEMKLLLRANPTFNPTPGAWPPEWTRILEETRALMPDSLGPVITFLSLSPDQAPGPWKLRVELRDPSGIGAVHLHAQTGSRQNRVVMTTSNGVIWECTIPNDWGVRSADGRAQLSLWVEGFDLKGNGPGRLASQGRPKLVSLNPAPGLNAPKPDREESILSKWWFWTAVGAAAIAGGSTVYVLTQNNGSPDPPPYGTGSLRVNVIWP